MNSHHKVVAFGNFPLPDEIFDWLAFRIRISGSSYVDPIAVIPFLSVNLQHIPWKAFNLFNHSVIPWIILRTFKVKDNKFPSFWSFIEFIEPEDFLRQRSTGIADKLPDILTNKVNNCTQKENEKDGIKSRFL